MELHTSFVLAFSFFLLQFLCSASTFQCASHPLNKKQKKNLLSFVTKFEFRFKGVCVVFPRFCLLNHTLTTVSTESKARMWAAGNNTGEKNQVLPAGSINLHSPYSAYGESWCLMVNFGV